MNTNLKKIIVILGPTASGKSGTAIKLAKKFNGEVLSVDSRQIYRGMDIGTGKVKAGHSAKIPQEFTSSKFYAGSSKLHPYFSEDIPHYGIDIVSPKTDYNAAKFKKYADRVLADILRRGKVPIIAGGTGFWIKSIVDNAAYPEVAPDPMLRNMLRNKTASELFNMLKELDSDRAATIDAKNPVRLIRAIEICKAIGKVPPLTCHCEGAKRTKQPRALLEETYQFLQIGIHRDKEELNERIKSNVKNRFETGMISEVERLHQAGLSFQKMESFGLSYRLIPQYLRGEILNEKDLIEKIYFAEKDYAKRQLTWFQKDKRIVWLNDYKNIEKEVKKFLEK